MCISNPGALSTGGVDNMVPECSSKFLQAFIGPFYSQHIRENGLCIIVPFFCTVDQIEVESVHVLLEGSHLNGKNVTEIIISFFGFSYFNR